MNSNIRRILCLLLSAVLVVSMFAGCSDNKPGTNASAPSGTGSLIITEVMASNSSVKADSFGEYPDWIELYNGTAEDISLKGCSLSDDPAEPGKYALPNVTIQAGQYLLIFASGRNTVTDSGEIHTGFKVSAGETVTLSCAGETLSSLVIPEDLPANISYGFISDGEGQTKVYFATPTPGTANGGTYAEILAQMGASDVGVVINEFMMKNPGVIYDEDGDCPDWVELRNISDKPVSLGGMGLSDDFSDPMKWVFPDVTLQPGAYLLVLLSGKELPYNASSMYLHASFKLGDTDDGLILSTDKGIPVDRIATVELPETASYGRDPQDTTAWRFFPAPTPGKQNSANGYETLDALQTTFSKKLYISEVCSVSSSTVDGLPEDDWIELYNNTSETINLKGWSLSKYIADLRYYVFPDVTIAPGAYLVINASGTASTQAKKLDAGFKLSHTGVTVYLTDAEGMVTDAFDTGMQRAGITSGRVVENDVLTRRFFTTATKGKANAVSGSSASYAQGVEMTSSAGVLLAAAHTITMTTKQPGGVIYYTTDGTEPTTSSNRYTQPIQLSKSTSIRAAVYADGCIPSNITTKTFLIEEAHSLNVVCITADPDDLFGYHNGIWADGPGWTETFPHKGANFWKDWEREVFFEYYEKDGTLGVSFSAGMKNHGQYSRAMAQKSVSINLKEAYGSGTTSYPFFGEDEISVFDNLLLRTGGQDTEYTNLIDAYCARVIAGQMDIDYMRDLPVAVYVNGEYWGLYYIREKLNESYIEHHHGIDDDNLDAIKGTKKVETGSYAAHGELLDYIKSHDLSKQEYFDYVASQIDLEEWTNYWIVESYFANTDTGNIRFYHAKDGSVKWRWILFDMDWALFRSTYKWNMIEEFIDPKGHGVGNAFSTVIAVGLFKNKAFKDQFVETYAQYMNTVFEPERMQGILDEMVDQIDEEMVRQCQRWGFMSYSRWQSNVDRLRTIINERWDYSKEDLQQTFDLSNSRMEELFPSN